MWCGSVSMSSNIGKKTMIGSDRYEQRPPKQGCPVVLKVGSSSLTRRSGEIDKPSILRVMDQVKAFRSCGYPTVLVSSGAVAAGSPILGGRPTEVTGLQVAAAVGQPLLMREYIQAFKRSGITVGQVLLTLDILSRRSQYLHARGALERMLSKGIVPIVNENDTVAVEELKLGDNDRLAAIVSHLVGAGMLIILTDTDGLYSADPRSDEGEQIGAIGYRDPLLDQLASAPPGPLGSGGVATKIEAARMAAWSGIPTVIARSKQPGVVDAIIRGEACGTYVEPGRARLPARKLWLAFGQQASGAVDIDAGAARALINRGSSLLSVGITNVEGEFMAGSAVEVRDADGTLVGKGLVSVGSSDIRRWMGRRSADIGWNGEVIHRDQLVVLVEA